MKAGHKEVELHPLSMYGGTVLECFNCGTRNIFSLGFITTTHTQEVMLICRDSCLYSEMEYNDTWDPEEWEPLISEKQFASWIVKIPEPSQLKNLKRISGTEIEALEKAWEDSEKNEKENGKKVPELPSAPVPMQFINSTQYLNSFFPLIDLEEEYDRKQNKSQIRKVNLTKRLITKQKKLIVVLSFLDENFKIKCSPGNELIFRGNIGYSTQFEVKGQIIRIYHSKEIVVELYRNITFPEKNIIFSVEFIWTPTSFERMKLGLQEFNQDTESISSYLFYKILGFEVSGEPLDCPFIPPRPFSPKGIPILNSIQLNAVENALTSPLFIIQGPPGTGKTVTSVSIIYNIVSAYQCPMLVCAPSNIAVDQLTEKIYETGLNVVRLCAKYKEYVSSSIDFLTLHQKVKELRGGRFEELHKLCIRYDKGEEFVGREDYIFRKLKREAEEMILSEADVICCTCISAFDSRLCKYRFEHVLIDEATQANEPECLLPIVTGAKQLILVGDHCQLGPTIMSKNAKKAGLGRSLFERLVSLNNSSIQLRIQYRMHPCISQFPSRTFYGGTLKDGVSVSERTEPNISFHWPTRDKPMFFFHSIGKEEISGYGKSYLNREEACNVEKIVKEFIRGKIKPTQIGIITPYEGQRDDIVRRLMRANLFKETLEDQIEVASVDSFQGREKDYIILSCVRSNVKTGIGFLSEVRRLNVALTRAKYGLIICGNASVLCQDDRWNNLLHEFKNQNLLFEGSFDNLRLSRVLLRNQH